ncbi:methyl-accepting chemotaxis sensory transducer with Cache sensor [Peptoclostridium litorale DSM 5388]|uniref:Methyl-accepting chemotaxis protein n=1 Tax=Peptoclostridium litorale DSM 5388 TaxID=1121324 RepID=A0A069RJJ2_PEPLI|nr:methyl-accepting chemotaxis protein [Peptoclostridium litorale]KDR94422.1 methyl-accepting chemotaxis protein [Peptoclostridium litorale DSM 5388]SIO24160.1 methyl-accepting chemotaxis sensory transducer with Cache sensor [Peptoclostridium litorale DSM 5388]
MKKILKIKSIKTKLTAMLLIVCIVPVVALGSLSYKKSYSLLSNKLKLTSQQNVEQVNKGIDNYFKGFESTINMLSNNSNFEEIHLNSANLSNANSLLEEVQKNNPDISSIYFGLSSDEFYVYPFEQLPDGYRPTVRPWYTSALSAGGLAYSEPYVANTGELVISVSKAVKSNDKIVGVVACDIDLDELSKSLSEVKIGTSGYVVIADANGLILAHPDEELLGADLSKILSIWNSVASNSSGFSQYKYKGDDAFAVFSTNSSTGWKIMASLDKGELLSDTNAIKNFTLISILLIAFIAVFVALTASNSISKHLFEMISLFQKASSGDLSVKSNIRTQDEFENLGTHFNNMIENINNLIYNVKHSCTTISSASDILKSNVEETSTAMNEVCAAIDQVSLGAASQSSDIYSGVESINMLANGIEKIEHLAKEMNDISTHATQHSREGLEVMDLLTGKTAQVNSSSLEVNDIVVDMNNAAAEIEVMAHAIDNIAHQTTLLSLNAAIEAARAGESGNGFSVVADEIRTLAEQSKESTKQINTVIEKIKSKSKSAVDSMEIVKMTINEQTYSVDKTVEIFTNIISSVDSLIHKIKEIEHSICDTNKEKEIISNKIVNISNVAEQNLVSTEEVVASAEEVSAVINEFNSTSNDLKSLAKELEINISKFKLVN